MTGFMRRRRFLAGVSLVVGLAVAGCTRAPGGGLQRPGPDDMAIGNPNAGVTLIEYGSTMCSHCAAFKANVFGQLKANYIDPGRILFIFREMLTPVDEQRIIPTIALAQYQVARCANATPQDYFARLDVMFDQQSAMFRAPSRQGIEAKLVEIGAAAGLSRQQVLTCIADPAGAARLDRLSDLATRDEVTGTPTFFLNGARLDSAQAMNYESLAAALDRAIAALRR